MASTASINGNFEFNGATGFFPRRREVFQVRGACSRARRLPNETGDVRPVPS
jgi:hypothetical protein